MTSCVGVGVARNAGVGVGATVGVRIGVGVGATLGVGVGGADGVRVGARLRSVAVAEGDDAMEFSGVGELIGAGTDRVARALEVVAVAASLARSVCGRACVPQASTADVANTKRDEPVQPAAPRGGGYALLLSCQSFA